MDFKTIANLAIAAGSDAISGIGGFVMFAEDAELTDLQKHDAKYHPDGYEEGDTCKYREMKGEGDVVDRLDPENVEGEEIQRKSKKASGGSEQTGGAGVSAAGSADGRQKAPADQKSDLPKVDDEQLMKDIWSEFRHNKSRSEKWLLNNLGIKDADKKNKAYKVLTSFVLGHYDKKEALKRLAKLSDGLPKDAWKKGAKGSGVKTDKTHYSQYDLPLMSAWSQGGSGGSSIGGTSTGALSKYFHAQGSKTYSRKKHEGTGLYETQRTGGKALAREEDIPGMTPFHKNRPFFKEHGTVPASLTDEQLSKFRYTANGSTYPMVGNIDGRNYIVKHGVLPEGIRRNADLNDHLRTEVAADRFMREAGLNVPVCSLFERKVPQDNNNGKIDEKKLEDLFDAVSSYKLAKQAVEMMKEDPEITDDDIKGAEEIKDDLKAAYKKMKAKLGDRYESYKKELKERVVNGALQPKKRTPSTEVVKVAEYIDGGVSLARSWHEGTKAQKEKMKKQLLDAYPILSFLEGVDSAKNDNILVDRDSNLWFIDNGASFDYRAQGGKKLLSGDNRMASSRDPKAKPWFWERDDPTDFTTGYLGLLYAPDQQLLQEILSDVTDQEIVDAAKQYDFEALAKTLPEGLRKPGLLAYAKKLNEAVRNPPKGWLEEPAGNA